MPFKYTIHVCIYVLHLYQLYKYNKGFIFASIAEILPLQSWLWRCQIASHHGKPLPLSCQSTLALGSWRYQRRYCASSHITCTIYTLQAGYSFPGDLTLIVLSAHSVPGFLLILESACLHHPGWAADGGGHSIQLPPTRPGGEPISIVTSDDPVTNVAVVEVTIFYMLTALLHHTSEELVRKTCLVDTIVGLW